MLPRLESRLSRILSLSLARDPLSLGTNCGDWLWKLPVGRVAAHFFQCCGCIAINDDPPLPRLRPKEALGAAKQDEIPSTGTSSSASSTSTTNREAKGCNCIPEESC